MAAGAATAPPPSAARAASRSPRPPARAQPRQPRRWHECKPLRVSEAGWSQAVRGCGWRAGGPRLYGAKLHAAGDQRGDEAGVGNALGVEQRRRCRAAGLRLCGDRAAGPRLGGNRACARRKLSLCCRTRMHARPCRQPEEQKWMARVAVRTCSSVGRAAAQLKVHARVVLVDARGAHSAAAHERQKVRVDHLPRPCPR